MPATSAGFVAVCTLACALAASIRMPARRVGTTGGGALTLAGRDAICLPELARVHEGWLPAFMGHPGPAT